MSKTVYKLMIYFRFGSKTEGLNADSSTHNQKTAATAAAATTPQHQQLATTQITTKSRPKPNRLLAKM